MALRRLVNNTRVAQRLSSIPYAKKSSDFVPGAAAYAAGLVQDRESVCVQQPWHALSQQLSARTSAERVQTATQPLPDPEPTAATYEVDVVTGDVRGAGTQAPAVLRLIGENGQSETFEIGNDAEESGFERGSRRKFSIQVTHSLGNMRRVFVQQVEVGSSEVGTGWFLHQIEVTSPDGQSWRFPCNSWLGRSDADGLVAGMERNLIPCEIEGLADPTAMLLEEPLKVVSGAVSLPHPEKLTEKGAKAVNRKAEGWGGEDAYFCTPGRKGIYGMGVADGVYMWKTKGIDSGLFSRTIMSAAREAVANGMDDVLKLLQGTDEVIIRDNVEGSSTVCLVLIDTLQGRLTSANLGDSGFLVLGTSPDNNDGMRVKYYSPQQEHMFGFPYQLGHHDNADSPEDAMLMTLPVASGDVIILGSDGLWDNTAIHDISTSVKHMLAEKRRPSDIARQLAAQAFEAAVDKKGVTPYSLGASEAFDMVYSGGKLDDVTVVVTHLQ